MTLWAGIDEAGYSPPLGPLVVAGTAFRLSAEPRRGLLWDDLADAVSRHVRGSAGRLVVNDSKKVYSPSLGLRRLEEGVLAFACQPDEPQPMPAADLLGRLGDGGTDRLPAWFAATHALPLPVETNLSALASQAWTLGRALDGCGAAWLGARACAVLPAEYNRIVGRTGNKSFLLFQKCGLILQRFWDLAGDGRAFVLVDKHGGRSRYRRLLLDVFPAAQCDVLEEGGERSTYRITDSALPGREMLVGFQEKADAHGLPTALASMTAKYVRELYMRAFNAYWQERVEGLTPTAGYHKDAHRFLAEIEPAMKRDGVKRDALWRCS